MKIDDLRKIQRCINNRLDRDEIGKKRIVGIIGDAPSRYAKSPSIWNAAFEALKIGAIYLPFDVDEDRLAELIYLLKQSDRVLGANVTVPYKVKVMDYLDGLDENAGRIKAVNTIARCGGKELVGSNTDGGGFIHSILHAEPGARSPLMTILKGLDVLMIGAGGSARAVAFHVAQALKEGKLLICNRTYESAVSLAAQVSAVYGNAAAIHESDLADRASKAALIINCTTKGQAGIRRSEGRLSILEPYSALAPANPSVFPESDYEKPGFYRDWLSASRADIEANNHTSLEIVSSIPTGVRFCDLIYSPLETVFLRHARLSGHRTLNGKGMNIAQAVEGLYNKVCREELRKRRLHNPPTYQRIREVMYRAW